MPELQIAKAEPLGIAKVEPLSIVKAEPVEAPSIWSRIGDTVSDNLSKVRRTIGTNLSDIPEVALGLGKMLITPIAQQGQEIGQQVAEHIVNRDAAGAGLQAAETLTGFPLQQMREEYQKGNYPELLGHALTGAELFAAGKLVHGAAEARVPKPTPAPTPLLAPAHEVPRIAKAEPLPESFGPAAYVGPERRAGAGGYAGPERRIGRNEPIDLSNPVEAAKLMMEENPQIVKESADLAARARASRMPAPPRGVTETPVATANDAGLPPKPKMTREEAARTMSREDFVKKYGTHSPDEVRSPLFEVQEQGQPGIHVEPLEKPRLSDQPAEPHPFSKSVVFRDNEGKARGVLNLFLDKEGNPGTPTVWVDPAFRRKGIATALYDAAKQAGYDLKNSGEALTPEGAALYHSRINRSPTEEVRGFRTASDVALPPVGDPTAKLRALAEIQNQPESNEPVSTDTSSVGARLRRRYVNQFAEVEDLMRAGGLDPLAEPAATNPVKQIDLAHGGTPGKIERASELFKSVLDDAEKAGIAEPLQDYLNLNAMEAGAETLRNRALREGDFTLLDSLNKGERLPEGFTPAELKKAREAWNARPEAERAPVEQLAKRVFKLNEDTLDRSFESGLIRPEVYQRLKARAAEAERTGQGGYSPLNRILDEVQSEYQKAGMNMPTQHVLYNLEGSERATQHPLVTSLKRMAIAMQEAEKNRAVQSLVDLPANYPDVPLFKTTFKELPKNAEAPAGYGKISVFREGERVDYAVPTPLADTVKALDGPTTRILGETLLRWTGGIFRTGTTTANLAFALPNVLRDVSDLRRMETLPGNHGVAAGLAKEVPVLPIAKQWAQSWLEVVRKTPTYLQFLDSGAAFSTFQKSMKNPHELLGIVQGTGLLKSAGRVFKAPLDAVKWFNNSLEEASKLTAFKRQRAAGATVEDAAWQTRRFGGSPDFARRGSDIAAINQAVPFINAQIQGIVRIVPYIKRHPLAAGSALAAITGKMALVQMYNNSFTDPDGVKSWDRITDVEKQSNWIVFIPGTFTADGVTRQNYIKIPAGHTVNLLRAPIQAMLDPRTRTAGGAADSVLQQMPLSPNLDFRSPGKAVRSAADSAVSGLNPVLKVPIEQMMNRDTFRGVPIVPRRMENVASPEQFTDTTTKSAVALGQAIGASPLRIQHAVRGTLGGVADQGFSIGDAMVNPREALTKPPILTPLAKRFIGGIDPGVDQVERNRNNAFYQALQSSETATATLSALKKRGDLAGAQAFLANPDNQQAISRATALQRVAQQINKLRAAQDRDGERELLKSVEKFLAAAQEQPK